ncbi:polysaccharide biosynthesis tyrosine autokinase [Rhizobium sp. LjRoot30]|uniref:GumC family protein n=1 Tax=Rhizobium sp. LjRoot30 TaxID=3342320 RepID=UPI003ECEF826
MDAEIDLKSITGLLQRQVKLILTTAAAILVISLCIIYTLTPRYSATALLMVDTTSKDLLARERGYSNSGADNARVESEVGILRSDQVLIDVIRDHNLIADEEFGRGTGWKDRIFALLHLARPLSTADETLSSAVDSLRSAVSISRNGLTYLISIGVTSRDPQKAAALANAMAQAYIRQQIAAKVSTTVAARDTIDGRVAALNAVMIENERQFDVYFNRMEAADKPELSRLREDLEQARTEHLRQTQRLAALKTLAASEDMAAFVAELGTPALLQLQKQHESMARKVAGLAENAPARAKLVKDLAGLDTMLRDKAAAEIGSLTKRVADLDDHARSLRQQLRRDALQRDLPPESLAELYGMQQSAEIVQAQYQNLLAKLRELDVQSDLQMPDSRIVSAALVPTIPAFPDKPLGLGLTLVCSLLVAIGAAVLREYFVGGFTSENQVEAVLKVPLTTVLPQQGLSERKAAKTGEEPSVADLMVTAPLSRFSEAIRRLRLNIEPERRAAIMKPAGRNGTVVLVTSALAGEGKSTVALSLGRACALAGQKTLLIDCDLRKPSICKHLHVGEPRQDFLDYLRLDRKAITPSEFAVSDPLSGLHVLLGGRRSDIPTDSLVTSDKMVRLLELARRHFDCIILDTPPVEPVVDALCLSRHADVVVFVIKWASTPQTIAKRGLAMLRKNAPAGTGVVSVLNQRERMGSRGDLAYYAQ